MAKTSHTPSCFLTMFKFNFAEEDLNDGGSQNDLDSLERPSSGLKPLPEAEAVINSSAKVLHNSWIELSLDDLVRLKLVNASLEAVLTLIAERLVSPKAS